MIGKTLWLQLLQTELQTHYLLTALLFSWINVEFISLRLFFFFFFKENCRSPLRTIGYHPFLCWCSECSNFTWPMNYTEMAVPGGLRGLGEGPCFLPGLAHRWSPGRGCSRYCLLQVGGTMPCLLLRAYWACAVWQTQECLSRNACRFCLRSLWGACSWVLQSMEGLWTHKQQVLAPVGKWHFQEWNFIPMGSELFLHSLTVIQDGRISVFRGR